MGTYFSVTNSECRENNRKRSSENDCSLDVPVQKRIRSTYDYIYQELFCKGEGSDLIVKTLGKSWKLHRLYVKQSPFFAAMLDGGWKESGCNVIELELSDPNINESSLNTVFGAFYRDTIFLSESTVLSILACATWFHMEDIRCLCSDFMEHRISLRNVVIFFQIAKQYNLPKLSRRVVKWLSQHLLLLTDSSRNYDFIRRVPVDLMRNVIATPNLIVVQLEQDVFLLLIKWVFLQQHPEYEYQPTNSRLLEDAYTFFTSQDTTFLESPEGSAYAPAFRAIRWEYVINVYKTAERMLRDRIVPEAWLSQVFTRQWLRLLYAHEHQTKKSRIGFSTGAQVTSGSSTSISSSYSSPVRIRATLTPRESTPVEYSADTEEIADPSSTSQNGLPDDVFWLTSERCGRRMDSGDMTYSWRWTGFHFGLDLVVKYKRRVFSVIRFTDHSSAEGAVSHAPHLRLLIAMRVKSICPLQDDDEPVDQDTLIDVVSGSHGDQEDNGDDESKEVCTPGVLSLDLGENELHEVLRISDQFKFPAVVSANLLRCDPIVGDFTSRCCTGVKPYNSDNLFT